jgi:hypothetical protein
MKVSIKKGGGVAFARKAPYEYDGTQYEADLKNGDIVKILDSGNTEQGQWGEQKNFKIKTRNGEKKLAFNQNTINVLAEEFGVETEEWVGKDVKVILKKDVIAGKKVVIPYLVVDGWSLDEYGELVKEGGEKKNIDIIEYPEEDINPEDIPF